MALVTGPLFSLGARGQLAKSLVYSVWRGLQYVRKFVIPANPNTAKQRATRNTFKTLNNMWNRSSTYFRAAWGYASAGRPFTDRNAFFGDNIAVLVDNGVADAVLTDMIFSRGSGAALPADTVVNTGEAGLVVRAVVTAPTPPAGWTLVAAVTAVVMQGDPDPAIIRKVFETRGVAPSPITNNVTMTGQAAASTAVTASWLEWTRPDGATAVSASSAAGTVVLLA